ncbi:sphingomyelin phosphodiesterase-like [Pararge aegeria]|uniref:Sphingomyelin phosphodiesterase n=1 Tax=Pararge aegeria aegeria TaxID=348720 RepID=A0A8S4RYG0_9NEOP|nr:sphingomyelin phosphodiesterase-like [Pararge aegeria]CAH2244200.1 jg7439 [Pararge aegeria aegeria]
MKLHIGILLIVGSSVATHLISSDDLQKVFVRYAKNEASEYDKKTIQDALNIYWPASSEAKIQNERRPGESVTCLICRSAFGALFDLVREGATDQTLISSVSTLCASLGFVTPRACRGIIELNIPILTHIIKTTPQALPRTFCGLVLQRSDNPLYCAYDDPRFQWTVDLPRQRANRNKRESEDRNTPLTIAVISEAHIDPLYQPNGVADCDEPTCCRKGQKPRTQIYEYSSEEPLTGDAVTKINNEDMLNLDISAQMRNRTKVKRVDSRNSPPAGFWGDYRNCDTPLWAFDDAIQRVASAHRNVDVVYYMGDSIDHHVWETTYELINEVNAHIIDKMRKEFGNNVLVVPSIGNHESQPTNQFAPTTVRGAKLNTTWLYEGLAKKWDFYLNAEAKASVRQRGAFAMRVRPGLRVISVNNNVAFKSNWWLVYDPLDAKRHLDWLVQELHKAEIAGDKVHILGHIPPGVHDFIYTWTREYNRIVTRFASTIAGEFTGHTHGDEFKIFYSLQNGRPISIAWGAGSVTAYTNFNLNYKIATIDPRSFEPTNFVSYIYNLTEANLNPNVRPRWFQLYDLRSAFGLRDLSPTSMDALVNRMATQRNRNLIGLYSKFLLKMSDRRWPYCNDWCKIDNLCRSVVTVLWRREKCDELRRLFWLA